MAVAAIAVLMTWVSPPTGAQAFSVDAWSVLPWDDDLLVFDVPVTQAIETLNGVELPPADTLRLFSDGRTELATASSSGGFTFDGVILKFGGGGTRYRPLPPSRLVESSSAAESVFAASQPITSGHDALTSPTIELVVPEPGLVAWAPPLGFAAARRRGDAAERRS